MTCGHCKHPRRHVTEPFRIYSLDGEWFLTTIRLHDGCVASYLLTHPDVKLRYHSDVWQDFADLAPVVAETEIASITERINSRQVELRYAASEPK